MRRTRCYNTMVTKYTAVFRTASPADPPRNVHVNGAWKPYPIDYFSTSLALSMLIVLIEVVSDMNTLELRGRNGYICAFNQPHTFSPTCRWLCSRRFHGKPVIIGVFLCPLRYVPLLLSPITLFRTDRVFASCCANLRSRAFHQSSTMRRNSVTSTYALDDDWTHIIDFERHVDSSMSHRGRGYKTVNASSTPSYTQRYVDQTCWLCRTRAQNIVRHGRRINVRMLHALTSYWHSRHVPMCYIRVKY